VNKIAENKIFTHYVLTTNRGWKAEIFLYPDREFISYWIVSPSGLGTEVKMFTMGKVEQEVNSLKTTEYFSRDESNQIQNLLTSLAKKIF
jgi:hypothetical protein